MEYLTDGYVVLDYYTWSRMAQLAMVLLNRESNLAYEAKKGKRGKEWEDEYDRLRTLVDNVRNTRNEIEIDK
jgi:hypothetical protein